MLKPLRSISNHALLILAVILQSNFELNAQEEKEKTRLPMEEESEYGDIGFSLNVNPSDLELFSLIFM